MNTVGDWIDLALANFHFIGLIFGITYVLAVICAVREIMHSRTSQGSIAWVITLLLFPIPTVLLYLVFGWKLFDGYADIQSQSGRRLRSARAKELEIIDVDTTHEWPVQSRVAQLPFFEGNEAHLLIDGAKTFDSIFAGIDRAKTYVLVQFYTIRPDDLGDRLAERLIGAAARGVTVHLLYDDIGSSKLKRPYLESMRDAGVQVSSFNHRHKLLRFYGPMRLNYRTHRKIVVVDGTEAWVGGHNVADDYLGKNPRFGRWRDTHVHVVGPAALGCALIFREDWHWATGSPLETVVSRTIEQPGEQSVLVMPTGPADKLEACAIAFTDAIFRARDRLWIVSPYFVPDTDVRTALYAAALRGVDVRILLPEKPDHLLVWLASNSHAAAMVEHDISIYRYTEGFLHQKVMLVDDEIAAIGTVNFDNRSFAINFEVTLWFTHEQMIAEVEAMLTRDFLSSRKTSVEDLRKIPLPMRFLNQAARLFSPIL